METEKRWYCFEVKRLYIGKCFTTEHEIRAAFPWCRIEGTLVQILALGK